MGKEDLKNEESLSNDNLQLLVLVRHAETVRNVAKGRHPQFRNRDDLESVKGIPTFVEPLSSRGSNQAREVGVLLKKYYPYFDCVYHPGYLYTQQTVDGILTAYDQKPAIQTDYLLRKRDQGFVYDMLDKDIESQFPWLSEYWQTFGLAFSRAPGSESIVQMAFRARHFIENLSRLTQHKSVLVVTHASTILASRLLMEGWSFRETNEFSEVDRPDNCAIIAYGSLGLDKGIAIGEEIPTFKSEGFY